MGIGSITNILLDPIFMFYLLPKGNEVEGAAIATFIANCIATTYFIIYILKHKDNPVFTLSHKYALKDKTFKKIYTSKKYETTNGLKFYSTSYSIGKKLEIDTSRILGSKTGYTNKAGTCISAYFKKRLSCTRCFSFN